MHYKANAYDSSSIITLSAKTLPALRQKVGAYQLDSDRPVTLAGFFRVEDDGTQVPVNDVAEGAAIRTDNVPKLSQKLG